MPLEPAYAPSLPPHTIDPRAVTGGDTAQAANRTQYMRVQGSAMLISKLGIHVGTASGNICLAVYANTGTGGAARPGVLKATTGSVPCPAAGEALVALTGSTVVQPGDWFALASDNATATFGKNGYPSALTSAMAFCCQQATAFPCPTTPTSLAASSSAFLIIGVE